MIAHKHTTLAQIYSHHFTIRLSNDHFPMNFCEYATYVYALNQILNSFRESNC